MIRGRHQKFPWEKYKVYNFKPYDDSLDDKCRGSCGTHALACLTGLKPKTVDKHLPERYDHWSDRRMVQFLRKRGFEVHTLSVNMITSGYTPGENTLSQYHVVLLGQECFRDEGTWTVVWNGWCHHSGDHDELDNYEFLISPIVSAYMVWHPKWKGSKKDKAARITMNKALEHQQNSFSKIMKYFFVKERK